MRQRGRRRIRSAEAKQEHRAVRIGSEMARGSSTPFWCCDSVVLRERESANSRSGERRGALVLGERAADREQPPVVWSWCGARPARFRIWEEPTRVGVEVGSAKKVDGHKSAHLGRGRNGSSRNLTFSWNAVSSPPRSRQRVEAGARGAMTHTCHVVK